MSGQHLFYILDPKRLEPATSADKWLGRIVKSYEAPSGLAFTPTDPTRFTRDKVGEGEIVDIDQAVQASQNRTLSATLTEIARISRRSDATGNFNFKSSHIITRKLENYGNIFREMKQDLEIQNDLKEMLSLKSPTAYMIVALLIWTDAEFEESRSKEQEMNVKGKLPAVSAVVAAHSGMKIKAADPQIEVASTETSHTVSKGRSPGDHIFAFEYKAVRGRFYSLMANFTPTLEDFGPRVKGDKVFSGHGDTSGKTDDIERLLAAEKLDLEMDEPDVFWTDTLGNDAPAEEEFGEIVFAFN